jgi:hypothetical protein
MFSAAASGSLLNIERGIAMADEPKSELRQGGEGSSAITLPAPLPASVAAYVRATNECDLDALLATFVDDALVNDQLQDYWGKKAIAAWASRDIIGERMTLKVISTIQHYGHSIVTAHVDGSFDKRGLPDPLVLAFYFSCHDGRIVQLIILRNQSGT